MIQNLFHRASLLRPISSTQTMIPTSLGSVCLSSPAHPQRETEHVLTWKLISFCTEDDSPYPEVRSAVANYDDPSMPVNTLRAWLLGIIWAMIIPGVNEFYYFRYPSIMVGGVGLPFGPCPLWSEIVNLCLQIVAQLVSFPIGRAWARWVPNVKILGVSLNPGIFTIKEHVRVHPPRLR